MQKQEVQAEAQDQDENVNDDLGGLGQRTEDGDGDAVTVDESELLGLDSSVTIDSTEGEDESIAQKIDVESMIPLFKNDGLHSYVDALLIIQNARITDRQVTFHAPCKPLANGQVYVYALQDGQSPYDWRFDGFQWHNLRANAFPKKNSNPSITRHEFRLLDEGRKVDFYRHEYHEYGQRFKSPITLDSWKNPFIVIHYFGTYPVNEALVAPHGNRKAIGDKRKVSNFNIKRKENNLEDGSDILQSALESIVGEDDDHDRNNEMEETEIFIIDEDEEETPSPSSITRKSKKRKTDAHHAEEIIAKSSFNLGNITVNGLQVTGPNFRRRCVLMPNLKVGKQKDTTTNTETLPLSKDDLYGCYLFQESLGHGKVLRLLDFTSGVNIIIAEDNFLRHVNCVLNSDILKVTVKFNYQPTAKLYRFCVSTLFMKHPIFENEPDIPVAVFLHRVHNIESHSNFFKTMKELIPALNSSIVDLTVNTENGVYPSAREALSDNPRIKSLDANSPRVSAAKLDFVLVSVARNPNCDHVKMIHLVYFLQCHFLNEITRSLLGNCEGDLLIQSSYDSVTCDSPSLAELLLPHGLQEIQDALGPPELISMLTRNPPVVLGSGSDYESCTRNELQLFEGLAHFFISKDRILWIKDRALFSVRGLGGMEYLVKLSGRTCSCMRGKACEHVLAVLIGTGLLARHS